MRFLKGLSLVLFSLLIAGVYPLAKVKVGDVLDARIETPHPIHGGYWKQEVVLPGARFLRLHALQVDLGIEDQFRLLDAAGREVYVHEGPLAEPFWLPVVEGDKAVMEIVPASGSIPWGVLVDQVLKGFAPLTAEGAPLPESICGQDDSKDAICYASDAGKTTAGRAVGLMQFISGGSGFECTGFLVSKLDHFLTCNHCITSEADAETLNVFWMYQYATCGGSGQVPYELETVGSHLVTTSTDYDYSLLLLAYTGQNPADAYGYLPLNPAPNNVGDVIWIPQHPEGGPKRFAVVSDMDGGGPPKIQAVNVDGLSTQPPGTDIAYYADTEPGSSGSPVLNLQNQVVALHHTGTGGVACTSQLMNQGVEMSLIYPQISGYLSGALAAQASAAPIAGGVPLTVTFLVTASGGTPPYTYDWDFGDGTTHSSLADPSHTYAAAGTYHPSVTVGDSAGATAIDNSITIKATGPLPTISAVNKLANPFRLKLTGANFQKGTQVLIGGAQVPQTTYKSATQLVAKKGAALKAMVPAGTTVDITVLNPDGGTSSPFPYTR